MLMSRIAIRSATQSSPRTSYLHGSLLVGVSATALLIGSLAGAQARSLQGSGPSVSAAAAAAATAQAGTAQAAATASQAMIRAAASMQGMRNIQAAARAAALAAGSTVPNGLTPGGLVMAPGAVPGKTDGGAGLWQGANLPTQMVSGGRTQVEIKQNEAKAILTWQTFNVGRDTDLRFDQSAGGKDTANWIALNRVLDSSAAPSRILGTIKADGQVYVINRNGIIFGGSSQVNVHTLVASSLNLSNEQFKAGIAKNILVGASSILPTFGDIPAETSPTANPAVYGSTPGSVVVEAGALIESQTGGKAMFFAPHVVNAGSIRTPGGQILMAGGENAWVFDPLVFEAGANSIADPDRTVRGLDVLASSPMRFLMSYSDWTWSGSPQAVKDIYVSAAAEMDARAASVGYQVVNNGAIEASRGNITIAARNVTQNGVLLASTALNNQDGSVLLRGTSQGFVGHTGDKLVTYSWLNGTLTLANGSVTTVVPDLTDTGSIELSAIEARYRTGRVDLRGALIDIQGGATVVVPSGTISAVASKVWIAGSKPTTTEPVRDGSRLYIGENALLSVAGLQDVLLSMESNSVKAELRINELRDSVLYIDSWLRGATVYVDKRVSGSFKDGPMAGVQWMQNADGSYQTGNWVGTPIGDVSAWIGTGSTSLAELSTAGGKIILKSSGDIVVRAGATLDIAGGTVRYADGYIRTTNLVGADGRIYGIGDATPDRLYVGLPGKFSRYHTRTNITETWSTIFDRGIGERFERGYVEGRDAGRLVVYNAAGFAMEGEIDGRVVTGERQAANGKAATAGTLQVGGGGVEDTLWLSSSIAVTATPTLLGSGFTANSAMPAAFYDPTSDGPSRAKTTYLDVAMLNKSGLGKFELYYNKNFSVTEDASLELIPGASLALIQNITSSELTKTSVVIDGRIRAAGGTITLNTNNNLTLGASAVIDVSGQWINEYASGAPTQAPNIDGGRIGLIVSPNSAKLGVVGTVSVASGAVLDVSGGGWLSRRGGKQNLRLGDAGTLELTNMANNDLSIIDMRAYAAGSGGTLILSMLGDVRIGGTLPADPLTRYVPGTLYADRGFRSVSIQTTGNVTIPEGETVSQIPVGVELGSGGALGYVTGSKVTSLGAVRVLDLQERMTRGAASLSIDTPNLIRIGAGATLTTDIGGNISFSQGAGFTGSVQIDGAIEARAGMVTINTGNFTLANGGRIDTRGVAAIMVDTWTGLRTGSVLSGGSVKLTATNIDIKAGSLIDVSGADGEVDLRAGRGFRSVGLASNGGLISAEMFGGLIEGDLRGRSGGPGASGGSIKINQRAGTIFVSDAINAAAGRGVVRPGSLQDGGFAELTLVSVGSVVFDRVDLSFTRSIAIDGIIASAGAGTVQLAAPYVSLSNSLLPSTVPTRAPTAAGSGEIVLIADLIDVTQGAFTGFAETRLVAHDLRLGGLLADLTFDRQAMLFADGKLALKAGQIYPATGVQASIKAGAQLLIEANGESALPLSAAGSLTLEAPVIEQNGVVRAPFGVINFKASSRVTLGSGSTTSVSGDGLVLPYGLLINGEFWGDPTKRATTTRPPTLDRLPEKQITLDAPSINVATGSVIDIRGGGDLHASEFVVGSGGSHNILAMPGVYAIVPAAGGATAPSSNAGIGSRIWLAGGNGLAAGWYALMPPQYALLPGAFAVQAVAGSDSHSVVDPVTLLDGTVLMSGRLGNGRDGAADALTSTFRVMSGSVVRAYSEFNEASANSFFASDAFKLTQYRLIGRDIVTPRLPADGGAVVFRATSELSLDGQLRSAAAPEGGRAGLVDIAATNIAVIGAGQDRSGLAGYLIIDSARLSSFGAASLLLGGVRSGATAGLGIEVIGGSIVVRNDASSALVGPEIILASTNTISISAGSVLRAEGVVNGGSGDLIIKPQFAENPANNNTPDNTADDHALIPARDYGALIRLSNGDVASVVRAGAEATRGEVEIGAGAVLAGGTALMIDATRNTTLAGSAQVSAADITLSGSNIGFGGGNSGLVFDAASLARFNSAQNLTLRSYATIDFYNGIDFGSAGLKSITLDATALVGRGAGATVVTGDTIVLRSSSGSLVDPLVANQGTLALNANQLVLGSGVKSLRGFNTVSINAGSRLVAQGKGSLDAGSASLYIAVPVITGQGGANQSIVTSGALSVDALGAMSARDVDSLGSRWAFTGSQVDFGGRVMAIGGGVSLTATAGNVVLRNGASLDVGGFGKVFNDVTAYTNAGTINLTAVGGNVLLDAGATLNLAATAGGGDAGSLSAVASGGGTVVLAGAIDAHAAAGRGGSFALDIGALSNFGGFGQQLEAAGFSRARQFRIRNGDVTLDGNTRVESFVLTTDAGRVTITGTVDASAAYGGSIAIAGGNGVAMANGASLIARSTTALGSGRVTLDASGGMLDITGGVIDVSGGEGGKVRFRAQQTIAPNHVMVSNLAATIVGARSAVLEGVWRQTDVNGNPVLVSLIDAALIAQANAAANAFAANAASVATRLGTGVNLAITSGIDIRSDGDLTLAADWDLSGLTTHQGSLTLRAAGNLNLLGNISDGFSNATRTSALLAQDSWDLRLVAGADINAADALAVRPIAGLATGSGSLRLGNATTGYLARTGTGDLAVRAGRDIQLAHYQSVIYTAGRQDTAPFGDFSAGTTGAVYGIQGGNLSIGAGGSVISTLPTVNANNMLYTAWLRKAGAVNNANDLLLTQQSTWWIDYSKFIQGVGALGGGNVNVQAGGDLDNLLVALATTGRVSGGKTANSEKTLRVDNGGAMTVVAGGEVKAGNYYIARGDATIDAGAFVVGRTVSSIITGSRPLTTRYDIAPVLALGDASLTVRAAGDLRVQTVLDPLMSYDPTRGTGIAQTYMLGQTDNSRVNLMSTGGDVTLVNQSLYLSQDVTTANNWFAATTVKVQFANQYAGNLYPALTSITALNGSIANLGQLSTLPAAGGELQMLAAGNIGVGNILMSRATPQMLASPFRPFNGSGGPLQYSDLQSTSITRFLDLLRNAVDPSAYYGTSQPYFNRVSNPDVLSNAGDYAPSRIYALNGSVRSGSLVSNEQTWISAGTDILDLKLNLRNLHGIDVSWMHAGNDFLYHTPGLNAVLDPAVTIQGPGGLLLTAGRDIYADTMGVVSTGNLTFLRSTSPAPVAIKGLSAAGASIELMAGLRGQQPDYAAVAAAYLDPANVGSMPSYLTVAINGELRPLYMTELLGVRDGAIVKQLRFGLISFIYDTTGQLLLGSPAELWAAYQALPVLTQQRFLRQVYMQELRAAGRDYTAGGATGGYARGYDAIARLFPGDAWKGNVQSGNLLVRTNLGGSIGVYTPGGGLEIAALNQNVEANYGLITLGYGRIDIFAKQNVVVNRSRVLTFSGGDITIWSTLGDINAGRGAKTTRVPSAPVVSTNVDTVTLVKENSDITGSGIGTVIGFSGVEPGDVDPIAPVGTVDAGDAGIRVSGNFNVAALYVLNTDNIKVGGETKGVPKAEAPAVNLIPDTKDKAAADAVKDSTQQNTANAQPSVIIVEVLGYGGASNLAPTDDDRRRDKDKDDRQGLRQDPNNPAQVVGFGNLTEQQKQALTEEEKRNL